VDVECIVGREHRSGRLAVMCRRHRTAHITSVRWAAFGGHGCRDKGLRRRSVSRTLRRFEVDRSTTGQKRGHWTIDNVGRRRTALESTKRSEVRRCTITDAYGPALRDWKSCSSFYLLRHRFSGPDASFCADGIGAVDGRAESAAKIVAIWGLDRVLNPRDVYGRLWNLTGDNLTGWTTPD
jgi:hypothetical protein